MPPASDPRHDPSLEIRIPISPTRGFYHQVRFFEHNLRRLGGIYERALLRVVVGDDADMAAVRRDNAWSAGRPVDWTGVPRDIFARHGMWGTADWRLMLPPETDLVVLADADTVWLRDIDPLRHAIGPGAVVAGHMAHGPPPMPRDAGVLARTRRHALWPVILQLFDLPMPDRLHPYSMDVEGAFGLAPAYFNLGFVVLTAEAMRACGRRVPPVQDRLLEVCRSRMRCQIALTLACLIEGVTQEVLPAEYNAANDPVHAAHNGVSPDAVRVLHYLRTRELQRDRILLPEHRAETLALEGGHPLDRLLLERVAEFLGSVATGDGGRPPPGAG
ncbi:hypothetical protein [Rhodobaculum claviforme]|uniref:Uncharacterized protein n=1 Tax=Rhodobaculum claviforme TaxID=1549854 RepID=A0A934WIA5_9RHOB|nr:hypothetical protein [Rhodobaculum claviforme]MBK5928005.1 hypothetical protein [Rhodobaculum claviforme]